MSDFIIYNNKVNRDEDNIQNLNLKFSILTKYINSSSCDFTWNEIEQMLDRVFLESGEADFYVLPSPMGVYYYKIKLIVINKKFKIFIHTTDENPKKQLLEWWVPEKEIFEGFEIFDHIDNIIEEDKRTIGSNINLAKVIFKDFFLNGQPSENLLLDFRSIWNPKEQA